MYHLNAHIKYVKKWCLSKLSNSIQNTGKVDFGELLALVLELRATQNQRDYTLSCAISYSVFEIWWLSNRHIIDTVKNPSRTKYCAACEVRLLFDIYRFWSAPLNMRTNSSSSLRSIERSINRQSNDGFYEIDRLTGYRRFAYSNEFPLRIVGMHDCVVWIALHVFDKIVAKSR